MNSCLEKHSILNSKCIPTSIAELERYKCFFPNINGAGYDALSIAKGKMRQSPDSTSSFSCSSFSFTDDGFSNASSSYTSEEESPGFKHFTRPITNIFEHTKAFLKTPQKSIRKRPSPRKPLKPMKSANRSDPHFRGATINMKTTLRRDKDAKSQPQLVIDCAFSAKKKRSSDFQEKLQSRRSRSTSPKFNPSVFKIQRSPTSFFSGDAGYDHELGVAPIHVEKECASCGVSKTPLWRDAEDGTPLCNACGIRYKKYRIRCLQCWYIPKKEEKALPCCPCCGHAFRVTLTRRGSVASNSD